MNFESYLDTSGMVKKPKLEDLKPIPYFDFSRFSEKDLDTTFKLLEIIEDTYPVDANEDFHIGVQWIIYLMSLMTEKFPVMPRNAILDMGIAALYLKQKQAEKEEKFPDEI